MLSPIISFVFCSVYFWFKLVCFENLFCVSSLGPMARDIAKVLGFWPTVIVSIGPMLRDIAKVLSFGPTVIGSIGPTARDIAKVVY